MNSLLVSRESGAASRVTHKVRLIWKNPETHGYHQVGTFEELPDGRYAFEYVPNVLAIDGFAPLLQFPDVGHRYSTQVLPAFLANRVMSSKRPSYETYLGWLGLTDAATPLEILARTGGPRATDTFHVVDDFESAGGMCRGEFFASGVRHVNPDLNELQVGERLELVDEPSNPVNSRAVLLSSGSVQVGWIPDWLLDDLHRQRSAGASVDVFVEQINRDAPPHLALLCRLEMKAS